MIELQRTQTPETYTINVLIIEPQRTQAPECYTISVLIVEFQRTYNGTRRYTINVLVI